MATIRNDDGAAPARLLRDLRDARARLLALTADLQGDRLAVPYLPHVNPPLWELGHVAWFQEWWLLRDGGRVPSSRPGADALYDSAEVAHRTRWQLPLQDLDATHAYLRDVLDAVLARADRLDPYFVWLAIQHEDMHAEAFLYTRQALGQPAPALRATPAPGGGPLSGDVCCGGHTFRVGAEPRAGTTVFDNEKWVHEVFVPPFALARAPVTQAEYAAFVDAGGYQRREFWSEEGWAWRERVAAAHPRYWQRDASGWLRADFDRLVPLEPHRPVVCVSWYEAEAYCRFAGRRLPSEIEWELAAGGTEKRAQPWGDAQPAVPLANVDGVHLGCADVGAFAAGDSPAGCRQMCGNVWEWTASTFAPYPGFVADPYAAYSAPWFHTHRVLRGGAFSSRGRMLRNTWRNFYLPWRRDVFSGFRTAALRV